VGTAADEVDGISVLNDVAILSNGDVWIVGECGRLLQYVARDARWIDHKSHTGAHLTAIDFADDDVGYATGVTGQTTIVRIDAGAAR
jgi:photosystem II stability/assembly factor-like uncharacterized protein